MPLITPDHVVLDLPATDRTSATRALAETLQRDGRVTDLEGYLADVARRESQLATGLPGGIAIPHARSEHVTEPSLAFGRTTGIDWGAEDGPARLVFLIAVPAGGHIDHLAILAKLARRLTRQTFREALLHLRTPAEVAALLEDEVAGA